MALVFEEPPYRTRANGHVRATLDELREAPGRWARVCIKKGAGAAASAAQNIRKGLAYGAKPGAFEAVARHVNGEHVVYARYTGSSESKE